MRYLRMLTQRDRRWRARRRVSRGARAAAESAGADRLDHRGPVVRRAARVLRSVSERRRCTCSILVREVLASRPLQPAWLSVRLLAWLSALDAVAAAIITWRESARVSVGARRRATSSACARARRPRRSSRSCSSSSCCCATRSAGAAAARLRRSCSRRWCSSVAVPLWLRGPGDLPVPPARRDRSADAARDDAAARADHSARRCVARLHPAARGRGAAAEFRHAARARRRDRSGDAQADAGRAGLGRGGDGQVPAEERRSIQCDLPRACR